MNNNSKYSKGKIYKIITDNSNDIYIGSTIQTLKRRLDRHKTDCKNREGKYTSSIIIKQGNYSIELIKNYPCNSKAELNAEEGRIQREMECVNRCIAGRSRKQWRIDNGEEEKVKRRDYYLKHKEKIDKKQKDYYKEHKEKIDKYHKEYKEKNKVKNCAITRCLCGGKYQHRGKADHLKTNKHKKYLSSI